MEQLIFMYVLCKKHTFNKLGMQQMYLSDESGEGNCNFYQLCNQKQCASGPRQLVRKHNGNGLKPTVVFAVSTCPYFP